MKVQVDYGDDEFKRIFELSKPDFKIKYNQTFNQFLQQTVDVFVENGYKVTCPKGRISLEKNGHLVCISMDPSNSEAINLAMCPEEAFDRWANSRHICYDLWFSWNLDTRKSAIERFISKAEILCNVIPPNFYDEMISITL